MKQILWLVPIAFCGLLLAAGLWPPDAQQSTGQRTQAAEPRHGATAVSIAHDASATEARTVARTALQRTPHRELLQEIAALKQRLAERELPAAMPDQQSFYRMTSPEPADGHNGMLPDWDRDFYQHSGALEPAPIAP